MTEDTNIESLIDDTPEFKRGFHNALNGFDCV